MVGASGVAHSIICYIRSEYHPIIPISTLIIRVAVEGIVGH